MKKLPILVVLMFLIGIMATTVLAYPTQGGAGANNTGKWSCTSLGVMPQAAQVQAVADKSSNSVSQAGDLDKVACNNTRQRLCQTNTAQTKGQAAWYGCQCQGNSESCICYNTGQMDCYQCPQYTNTGYCADNSEPVQVSHHNRYQNGHHR